MNARRLGRGLGVVEIVTGLGFGLRGCALSVDAPGPTLFVMLIASALPVALVVLPGAALAARWRRALYLQVLPLAFALLYATSYVTPR